MEMFLMAAVMSLLAVAVSSALFSAATRGERPEESLSMRREAAQPARFFASEPGVAPVATLGPVAESVPVEALLLRIEQHIRLEQAAAESFLHTPNGQSLHSRTSSRHVN